LLEYGTRGHLPPQDVHIFVRDTAPTVAQSVAVGDIWSDTTANVVKRCTGISPVTFTSIEGSGHDAVTVSGTPDYITLSGQDIVRGLIVLTTDISGVLPVANGGTALSAQPDIEAWISAAAMKGLATAGAGDSNQLPESRELATNDINIDFIAFDTATEEHAYFNYPLPKGWNEGTVTFTPYWTAASGSGGVTWGLAGLAVSNDGALDAAVGTEVDVDDTLLAADDVHIGPESAAVTLAGTPAESDWCYFVIARKVADANDTLGVDAQLLGIKLTFTRASYTD